MEVKKVVLLGLLIAMVALAGCSQSQAPKQTPTSTPKPTSTPSGGGGGVSGIPVYSGSNPYSAPTFYYQMMGIPEGISVKVYYVENANVKDILNWYKEKLSDYEVAQDVAIVSANTPQGKAEWGAVLFKKGDRAVGIWAMSGAGIENGKGAIYYIAEGPVDKLTGEGGGGTTTEGEQLPSTDQTSGKEPVERYPGAVMLSYSKDTSNPLEITIGIDYGTKDDAAKVAEWYKQELQAKGWVLESEASDETGISLSFSKSFGKGKEFLDIDIMKPYEGVSYTEIDVDYRQKGLPSEDLVSGKEPMERYPGSVMLSYSTSNVGGVQGVTVTYGSGDDGNSIFQWYTNKLKSEGWEVITGTSPGQYTVVATKGSNTVHLEITEEDAYTKITLYYATSS